MDANTSRTDDPAVPAEPTPPQADALSRTTAGPIAAGPPPAATPPPYSPCEYIPRPLVQPSAPCLYPTQNQLCRPYNRLCSAVTFASDQPQPYWRCRAPPCVHRPRGRSTARPATPGQQPKIAAPEFPLFPAAPKLQPKATTPQPSKWRTWCRSPDLSLVIFCLVSFLALAAGCVTLGLGAVAFFEEGKLTALIQLDTTGRLQAIHAVGFLKAAAIILMVAGGTIVFLGFLGCSGVLLKSKAMVGALAFLILVLVVAQLIAAALALFYRETAQHRLKQALLAGLRDSYDGQANSSSPFSQAIDFAQTTLGCCGVEGARDFNTTPWFRQHSPPNATVPRSCCRPKDEASRGAPPSLGTLKTPLADESCPYKEPGRHNPNTGTACFDAIRALVMRHIVMVLVLAATIVAVEVSAMCSAFAVVQRLRLKDKEKKPQEPNRL